MAKALTINTFSITGRFVFIYQYTHSAVFGYVFLQYAGVRHTAPLPSGEGLWVGLICKYNLCSKKVLQMKNRFQRFLQPVLLHFQAFIIAFFIILSLFLVQKDYNCIAKRLHLQCKTNTSAMQKGYIRMAKVVLLQQKGAFLSLCILLILLLVDVTLCV